MQAQAQPALEDGGAAAGSLHALRQELSDLRSQLQARLAAKILYS